MTYCDDNAQFMSELRRALPYLTAYQYRKLEFMVQAGRGGEAMRELTAIKQFNDLPIQEKLRQGSQECGRK